MTRLGVVVMAYGTPRSVDDVEAFYTHIRRGRPPEPAQLADLVARYEAIGGISPLGERTEAQRAAIEAGLARRLPDPPPVVLGQRHAAPFIEDAFAALDELRVTHAVALVLSPHYSRMGVGQYLARATEAGAAHGIEVLTVERWHLLPAYLDFLADAIVEARVAMPARHVVLISAHSLPERALANDSYPDELRDSAEAVAAKVGLEPDDWALCWQSAGRTAEPWRGPDILDVIRALGAGGSIEGVLVCAQGFAADHLEVLHDLDIEAHGVATQAGLTFARTRSINDDPAVMDALAELVAGLAEKRWGRAGQR